MKKIFEFEFLGSFCNFQKVSEIPGTYVGFLKVSIYYRDLIAKIRFFRKVLGHLYAVPVYPVPLTSGVMHRWHLRGVGAVLAWLPPSLTGGPAWGVTCKTGKIPCAGEGSNPRRVGALRGR